MTEKSWTACHKCGIEFGMPSHWLESRREDGFALWCPNGHRLTYGEGTNAALRRERDLLQQKIARVQDDASRNLENSRAHERTAQAYKGHATRLRKRIKGGACPCCNRTFQNLSRHMATQHPSFDSEMKIVGGRVARG